MAPSYLPEQAQRELPWTRAYVTKFAAAEHVDLDDCWQAAIAALLRASVNGHEARTTGRPATPGYLSGNYAKRAVQQACWRVVGYWMAGKFVRARHHAPLDGVGLVEPSAEEEALAWEAVRARL